MQMSIRRQNLERSSKELSVSLAQLQRENMEQEHQIDSTLNQLQQQQKNNQQLLKTEWSKSNQGDLESPALPRKVQREVSFTRQLKLWTTADVIRWLEDRKLHKFILLFQRHHVAGLDLVDLKLPFLEDYDHISMEDRELLLAEVYELLRLECPDHEDTDRIKTMVDRQKYQAAIQLTKDRSDIFHRSQSVPVVLVSQRPPSPSSPSSSSPTPKLRKKTEGEGNWATLPRQKSPGSAPMKSGSTGTLTKPKRQLKLPDKKTHSLYRMLESKSSQELYGFPLKKENGFLGVSFATDRRGHVVLHEISEAVQHQEPGIRSGDCVIEANGIAVSDENHFRQIEETVLDGTELQLVICCDISQRRLELRRTSEMADQRWWMFHKMLTDMKDQDIDPEGIIKNIPQSELSELKARCKQQEELSDIKERLQEKENEIEQLKLEMKNGEEKMWEMKRQRDAAVKVSDRLKSNGKRGVSSQGESEYYKITMNSLNLESASKEKVISSLEEIVKEASRQKFYLDRLISVVIEESPWILEEVDADFDDVPENSSGEQFC